MQKEDKMHRRFAIIVVGLSGAGKTTVLHTFTDNGFDVIDGLPLNMLSSVLIPSDSKDMDTPIAVGIDTVKRDFSAEQLADLFDNLSEHPQIDLRLLFLDCQDREIMRRYTETRRLHPYSRRKSLATGIVEERKALSGLQELATNMIDTSELNSADLKRIVEKIFTRNQSREMVITVMSFAYRNGLPQEADIVFDVRCLKNPHYAEELRPLTGLDEAVGSYIRQDVDYAAFMEKIEELLAILLPRYVKEGKSYLTIAVGCTGGRHRSVYVAEELAKWLAGNGHETISRHREIGR